MINIKNSRGPSMLPWGTPERTGSIAELQPFIETCWTLFVRYKEVITIDPDFTLLPQFQKFDDP